MKHSVVSVFFIVALSMTNLSKSAVLQKMSRNMHHLCDVVIFVAFIG